MRMNEVADNVRRELLALQQMTLDELKDKWVALYGKAAPNFGVPFLRRRLSYRVQELAYGGVSKATLQKIMDDNVQPEKQKRPKVNLRVGTIICRVWHRKRYEVMVLKDGFEMDGKMYSSLSSIATKICGVNRNGFEFFGIQKG
jgi:hypothetical protein